MRIGSPEKGSPYKTSSGLPIAYVVETATPPVLDGKLTDECWSKAQVLRLIKDLEGKRAATVATEVRLLRDANNLYVAYRCVEPLTDKIRTQAISHDSALWNDDTAEFFIGSDEVYYHFIVNAAGITYDGSVKDATWESGIQAAGAIGKGEWTMEAAIPIEKIAGGEKEPSRFIANFNRNRQTPGSTEELAWSPTLSDNSHVPTRFGELRFAPPPKVSPDEEEDEETADDLTFLPVAYIVETAAPPAIDGKINDECWSKADVLYMKKTLRGDEAASVPTEVRLLRDAKNLYIAYRLVEPFTDKLKTTVKAHDGDMWNDDSLEFFIGSLDIQYHFGINSGGATLDASWNSNEKNWKKEWESDMKSAAAVGQGEWTAEFAIPIEKLATGETPLTRWVANFNRSRQTQGRLEEFAWSPTLTDGSFLPTRSGEIRLSAPPPQVVAKRKKQSVAGPVKILSCTGGDGVARFDLSSVPKNASILRADLFIQRTKEPSGRDDEGLVSIEIYPLFVDFKEGGTPKADGKPLALREPWFDCFDATAAVRAWAGGKANGGFFVKALPFWKAKGTYLEIVYEGQPQNVPPQASGLKVFHRSGQTFITWKEINDPVGEDGPKWIALKRVLGDLDREQEVRYAIYRSRKPITAANLSDAERIAVVRPLSSWNINGRNVDQPIDEQLTRYYLLHGQWNPFSSPGVDGRYGLDCRMQRLVIEDGGLPLSRTTGLYVHTAAEKGKACYAVVTSVNGVQNTVAFSQENSLAEPVAEVPAEPQPVFQGELPRRPYWNYPETRHHYVHWVAPPCGNLPCQYYNWSVGVPVETGKGAPVELSLHRDGHSYFRTQYRLEQSSVVLSPHDFPIPSCWYGYHEAAGTLKSFQQGVIHNYTERRILAFIEWAAKKWPVDRNRVTVTAMSGAGVTGAMLLAIRHPEVFQMVITGTGVTDFKAAARENKRGVPDMEWLWGKFEWDIKTDTGKTVWDELNLTRIVRELPAKTELPFLSMCGSGYGPVHRDFFLALLEKGAPVMAYYNMWGGRMQPVSLTGNWGGMIQQDIRGNLSLPAFREAGTMAALNKKSGQYGNPINLEFRWNTDDLVDESGRYEITLQFYGRDRATTDVTLRRIQKFKVKPGKTYSWEFAGQKGEVAAGESGLLTIPNLKISTSGGRLVVTPK